MKATAGNFLVIGMGWAGSMFGAEGVFPTAPPVVVLTAPAAETVDVDPATKEIRVIFSHPMKPGGWSWSPWEATNAAFPATSGEPRFLPDEHTWALPVKLEPEKSYALWVNTEKAGNFKSSGGISSLPYLLTFRTRKEFRPGEEWQALLNDDQRRFLVWTDRSFHSFFESRTFDAWPAKDKSELEKRSLEALKGLQKREYYAAINTLASLGDTNALPELRRIAFDRTDKDNRDRWMAIRALGMLGDKSAIPELIHLVYHGNVNTRWWAQISLVRLTGRNFGGDWNNWASWWNDSGGLPKFQPETVRWWSGQAEGDKLAVSLAESDQKFFERLR